MLHSKLCKLFELSLPLVLKPFAVNQSQVSSAMPIGSFLGQPKDLKVNQSMLIEDLPQAEQLGGWGHVLAQPREVSSVPDIRHQLGLI